MSEFRYRTRIGDSPRGKQKLYFCCHPDDFDKYFEIITSDIFKCNDNCAFYYEAEPLAPYDTDDLAARFGEMRSFVVPVTKSFLTESSRATEFEIPFARRHNIPIVPIAFVSEMDELFGKVFGNIQYLTRDQNDETAISYVDKLRKLIDTLLIGVETERRIREEFAARIFMSYRKKDRKYANEVMRRIHEVDFCRDVAIWYDEFLVPGEDFNDAIRAAVEGCDVFAMTVTPNLLEAGNYVGEEEYPAAKRLGKPVAPFEAVRTKGLKFSRYYFGIKTPADMGSGSSVEQMLRDELIGTAGRKDLLTPDDRPEHLYFMGLAYKNGIDVQRDGERAAELLEKAAEGLPEANLVMAKMHENGDGVPRDPNKALRCYTKFILAAEENIGMDPDKDVVLLDAYDSRADLCARAGHYAEAEKTYGRQLGKIILLTMLHGTAFRTYLISCYEKLGDVIRRQDRPEEAERIYREQYKEIGLLPDDEEIRQHKTHFLVNCLGRLADVNKQLGNTEEADSFYSEINRILDDRHGSGEEGVDAETLYGRAISSERLGDSLLSQGRPEEALKEYGKALELLTKLASGTEDAGIHMTLAAEFGKAGSAYAAAGNRSEAEKNYLEAYRIKKEYADNENDLKAQRSLSVTCSQLHSLYLDAEEWDKAEPYLKEDLRIAEMIAAKTDTDEALADLARTYSGMGLLKSLDAGTRLEYMNKAHDIYVRLQEERGIDDYFPDRTKTEMAIGQILAEQGAGAAEADPADTDSDSVDRAKDIAEELVYSDSMMEKAAKLAAEGDYHAAQLAYMKAEVNDRDLYEIYKDDRILRHLSTVYVRLGELFEARGDSAGAQRYYKLDLGIARKLAEGSDDVQARDDLAVSCYKMGMLESVDRDERVKYLEEARDIWQKLYFETGITELGLRAGTMAGHIKKLKPFKLW